METVYYNGDFVTVNEAAPKAEAVLVRGGIIVAIGSNDEILAQKDADATMIDLEKNTVLPGFIDGHSHTANAISSLPKYYPPPVGDIDSKEKLLAAVKKTMADENLSVGEWFVGMGYDNAFFQGNLHPTREELDHISSEHPILLLHVSGHVAVANSKAFDSLNVTRDTPNPEGGIFQKDGVTGELTGLVEEKAVFLFAGAFTSKGVEDDAKKLVRTQKFYASFGITTAQDGGSSQETVDMLDYCNKNDIMIIDFIGLA